MKLALVDDFVPALVVGDEVLDVSGALHGMEAGPPPLAAPSDLHLVTTGAILCDYST